MKYKNIEEAEKTGDPDQIREAKLDFVASGILSSAGGVAGTLGTSASTMSEIVQTTSTVSTLFDGFQIGLDLLSMSSMNMNNQPQYSQPMSIYGT